MTVTTQREECTRTGWRATTNVDGTGPTAMEAGVHHGRGTTPAPAHVVDRRVGSIAGGDRGRQEAIAAPRRRAGDQLLRGGPRRVLDPPVPHRPGDRESGGGLVEHRGESTRPARQDRSDGRGEAIGDAAALCRRRTDGLADRTRAE